MASRGPARRRDPQATRAGPSTSRSNDNEAARFKHSEIVPAAKEPVLARDHGRAETVLEQSINEILETGTVVRVEKLDHEFAKLIPSYVHSFVPEPTPPHFRRITVPPPGGSLGEAPYKDTIRCCLASWEANNTATLARRLALCDWLSRTLKIPVPLHQAALTEAAAHNSRLLVLLHSRLHALSANKRMFDDDFMSADAARAYHKSEVEETLAYIKQVQRQPECSGLLEVGVLGLQGIPLKSMVANCFGQPKGPYVEVALMDASQPLSTKRRRNTNVVHYTGDSHAASWMEKVSPAIVQGRATTMRLQVRNCNPRLHLPSRMPLEAARAQALKMSSELVGEAVVSVSSFEHAVLPTPLTFQIHEPEKGSTGVCGCLGGAAKGQRSSTYRGSPEPPRATVGRQVEDHCVGQLRLVCRFFQEHRAKESMSIHPVPPETKQPGHDGGRKREGASRFLGQDNTTSEATSFSGDEARSDTSYGTAEGYVAGSSESANLAIVGSIPPETSHFTSHEMLEREARLDVVLGVLWGAWERSRHCLGLNDSEVSDAYHNKMTEKHHTFALDPSNADLDIVHSRNDTPYVTHATGDFIFPEVPSLLAHLVTDAYLVGLTPDKSWWAVVQLFCTMWRIRKPRRDLAVLQLLLSRWHLQYGYLRGIRGLLQHLVAGTRKQELTWTELSMLADAIRTVTTELGLIFSQGSSKLLLLEYDQAVAVFKELQRLLLLVTSGDSAAYSVKTDEVLLQLLARGAKARLTKDLPDDPKSEAFVSALIRNCTICTDELKVDKVLAHESIGGVNLASHSAYVRYGVIKQQFIRMVVAAGVRPYSPLLQLLEDKIYFHHKTLAEDEMLSHNQEIEDPLRAEPPMQLLPLEEMLESSMHSWIREHRDTAVNWARNAISLDQKSQSSPVVIQNLNSSLLELMRMLQEMLGRISRRAMRANSLSRRFRLGELMTELFETGIQTYAETLSRDFVDELEDKILHGQDWPCTVGLLTKTQIVKINSLWMLLSNQHIIEQSIQECVFKGKPYEALRLDTKNSDLKWANEQIQELHPEPSMATEAQAAHASMSSDEESLNGFGESDDEETVQTCMARMFQTLKEAQQAISDMVLEMGVAVSKALHTTVSSFLQHFMAPGKRNADRNLDSASLDHLSDLLSNELGVLQDVLNVQAFKLVLETSWYALLRSIENGILQMSCEWVLYSSSDRAALQTVIELLEDMWHGDGMGLPKVKISRSSARLKKLLQLHGGPVQALETVYRKMISEDSAAGPSAGCSFPLSAKEERVPESTQLAYENIRTFNEHMKSFTLRGVGLLDIAHLLRQQGPDKEAEQLMDLISRYVYDDIKGVLGLRNAGQLILRTPAVLQESHTSGQLFLLRHYVVFTDLFTMASKPTVGKADSKAVACQPGGSSTELLPCKHLASVRDLGQTDRNYRVQLVTLDNAQHTFAFPSRQTASQVVLELQKLRQDTVAPPGRVPSRQVSRERRGAEQASASHPSISCCLKQLWSSPGGTLSITEDALCFTRAEDTSGEVLLVLLRDIADVRLEIRSGWLLKGPELQVLTHSGTRHSFAEMTPEFVKDFAQLLRNSVTRAMK